MAKVGILITESPHYDITSNLLIKYLEIHGIEFILLTDNERSKRKFPNSILIGNGGVRGGEELRWPLIRYIFGDVDRSVRSKIQIKINNVDSLSAMKYELKNILVEKQITDVIFEWPSHSFSLMCKEVCEELKISYLGMTNARIKNMVSVEDISLRTQQKENMSFDELKAIFSAPPSYMEYMKQGKNNLLKLSFSILRFLPKKIKLTYLRFFDDIEYRWYRNELNFEWRTLKVKLINFFLKLNYSTVAENKGLRRDYIYFMQYAPEASVSILGWRWLSQLHIIYEILLNIENDSILYIKEHPSQSLFSDLEFLRYVTKFPNVRVLHHHEDIDRILKNIKCSFTVSSTAGFRSLFNEVPVISLGECPDLKGVSGVYEYEQFKNRTKDYQFVVDLDKLTRDMNKYRAKAFDGQVYTQSPEEIERFVETFVKKLKNK
jgi:Capsule polysaccharide biosynthesis protein